MDSSRSAQRAVIQFLRAEGEHASQIYRRMKEVYGEQCLARCTIERYCNTLLRLKQTVKNKRRGKLSNGIVLLQDNARPHVAKNTLELLEKFRWEVLQHPPLQP
ncbi:hypothetical protein AVEN_98611-1 [Araneus ventricosus]|uniref:Mos1 transposase HTH domain-containing protein n=1 Tax=Araneus ventricosus TaxID=182803 RepID=A0A4Y2W909_ARAVE|nr:hypothetical protein AVEN_98611-1 [Araneus ventricosus]